MGTQTDVSKPKTAATPATPVHRPIVDAEFERTVLVDGAMSRNPNRAPVSRIGAVAQKPTHNDNNVAPTQNPLTTIEEEKEKIRSVAPTIFLIGLAIGVGAGVGGAWIFCKIFKKDPVAVLEKALEATY